MKILMLNGPNLNLVGTRQPEIYGTQSLEGYISGLRKNYPEHELVYEQSNHEGRLIDLLHAADGVYDGIIFNPGAYAHTSIALADAVRSIHTPVVEVHISNIHAREPYRRHSYVAEVAMGVMAGFGLYGYELALRALITMSTPHK